jgi:hypothetical protein
MASSRDTLINGVADLAKVLGQDKFASVLADLREAEASQQTDHLSMLDSAKKDGKAYLQSQGVTLPDNAKATITQNSPITVKVCLMSGDHEIVCVTVLAQ